MSFGKPCHMPFYKLILPFTLTELRFTSGRRLNMTSWKQPALASYREVPMKTEPESKLTKKIYKIRRRFLRSDAVVSRQIEKLFIENFYSKTKKCIVENKQNRMSSCQNSTQNPSIL